MGRGRDLTSNERTIVAMNIKRFWNYERGQRSKLTRMSIVSSIITCSVDQVVYSI